MATNKQLKFFKGANAPAAPAAGMIWFCTTDRTIRVYTGTEWEKYSSLVNAEWVAEDKKLNITSANGTVTTLDLSDMASASGVAAALELKADKTQVAADISNAIAAEVTRADNAYDPKGSASAAQAAAIAKAEELDGTTNSRIDTIEAEYKAADDEILGQIEDIVAASVSVKNADGDKYVVVTKAEDKNEYTIASKGIDDAIKVESDRAAAAEQGLGARIDALDAAETGRVSVLEAQVAALNAATHFEGKVEFDPSADGATTEGYEAGDIVIYGNKEYIFDGAAWIELGDTTAEANRISTLESWKTEASQDIADLDAAIDAVAKDLSDNYATDAELQALADGAVKDNTDKIAEIEGEVDLNTAAVADYKTRIEALEGTANALGTTYVKVADYNAYKDEVSGKFTDVEGRVSDLEGFQATTEATLESIATAQESQDTAIAAAKTQADKGVADAAAALAEAKAKVASVSAGNDYVSVGGTATDPTVSVNVIGQIAEGNTGLVKGGDIFTELCWVEFA